MRRRDRRPRQSVRRAVWPAARRKCRWQVSRIGWWGGSRRPDQRNTGWQWPTRPPSAAVPRTRRGHRSAPLESAERHAPAASGARQPRTCAWESRWAATTPSARTADCRHRVDRWTSTWRLAWRCCAPSSPETNRRTSTGRLPSPPRATGGSVRAHVLRRSSEKRTVSQHNEPCAWSWPPRLRDAPTCYGRPGSTWKSSRLTWTRMSNPAKRLRPTSGASPRPKVTQSAGVCLTGSCSPPTRPWLSEARFSGSRRMARTPSGCSGYCRDDPTWLFPGCA